MANTYKAKRGMVFWYNLDERVDKNARPTIMIDGKTYPDHRQYGMRHWLIVSNDDGNLSSPICTAVPLTGAGGKTSIPTHVAVTFRGRKFEILCEQIMTVNIKSLKEYAYTLSDEDMHKVDRALAIQCSLTHKMDAPEIELKLLQLEQRIESMMSQYEQSLKNIMDSYDKRLSELMKETDAKADSIHNKRPEKQNDGKKDRGKAFMHPTHISGNEMGGKPDSRIPANKHLSQVEKFKARYPDAVPAAEPALAAPEISVRGTDKKRNKWTVEMMEEYLNDTETLSPMCTAEKWDLKNIRTVYSMKYYIQNQLKKAAEAT